MKRLSLVLIIVISLQANKIIAQSGNEKFTRNFKEKDKDLRNDWPESQNPIYEEGTLGNKLQKHFMEHCQFCGFGDSNPKGNYLPNFFVKDESLRKKKVIDLPIGGEGLLTYLFTEADIKNIDKLTQQDIVGSRILKIDGINKFDISTANPQLNNSYISQSCSGYFNAKFNAKITPPFSIIEAATKAETDVSKSGYIVAIEGDFLSPLPNIFNAYNVQGFSFNSSLWDYYCLFPDNDGTLHYLNNYQGVLVRRFAEKDLSVDVRTELRANGSFGVVNLSSEANAGVQVKNLFRATNWSALILSDLKQKSKDLFLKLKTSAEIESYFNSPSYRLEGFASRATPVMVSGKDFIFEFFIGGLSKRMSTDYWNIDTYPKEIFESKPELISCTPTPAKGINGCLIRFKGKPKDAYLKNSKGSGKIEFDLIGNKETKLSNKALKIKAYVQVKTNSRPDLLVIDEPDTYANAAVAGEISWEYKIKIDDEGNGVDFLKAIRADSTEYKAIANTISELKGLKIKAEVLVTSPVEKSLTLKLTTKNANLSGVELENRSQDYELQKTIFIELSLSDGSPYKIPFPISLRYPKKKQQVEITTSQNN